MRVQITQKQGQIMPNVPFFYEQDENFSTHVKIDRWNRNGHKLKLPAIIDTFMGSDNGLSEAKRLCDHLNKAWTEFHASCSK